MRNTIQPRKYIFLALSFFILGGTMLAQDIQLTGTTIDTNGEPIPGVSVVVKGTTIGTQSDFDGNFNLSAPSSAEVLILSYIGLKTQEISINGQIQFSVKMEEDVTGLDEVVVVGYGGVKKSDLTGSVSSVSSDDLNRTVNQSFVDALDGRASGVKIQSGTGAPGGDITIRIRGGTSISASNEPLYVIDGFPVVVERSEQGSNSEANATTSTNALAGIDPKDIESIQILKDASATAIYGSRGANGVVIITTKKGRVGKSTVSFETFVSSQSVTDKIDVLDAVEFAEYQSLLLASMDAPNEDAVAFYSNPEDFRSVSRDWQDEIYRNALIQNYRLGLNGGSEAIRYNVTAGAFLNEGIIEESAYNRYNARINLSGKVGERFRFNSIVTGSFSEQTGLPTGGANNTRQGIVSSALVSVPFDVDDIANPTASNLFAPQATPADELAGGEVETRTDFFQGNLSLEYDLTENLTLKTLAGATTTNQKTASFFSSRTGQGNASNGIGFITQQANRSYVNENTLTFKKEFGNHNITVLGGGTFQETTIESFTATNANFAIEDLGFNALGLGTDAIIPTSILEQNSIVSALARLNYGYKDKYLVTLSYRADGSSRFADGEKFGYFPAAALAWKVNNEKFLENSQAISNLKLRVGYGVTGNQEVPRFRSLSALNSGFYPFGTDNGSLTTALTPDRVANPDLTWETTKQFNLGVDFGFFNNRFSGTIDLYNKTTDDLLLEVNLIPTAGVANPALRNVGSLRNKGLEIALRSANVQTENFSWTTDFNISFNDNEILELGAFDQIFIDVNGGWHQIVNEVILTPGEAIGSFFGFVNDGIFPVGSTEGTPGTRRFVDQNADGVINDDDRMIIGTALPDFFGGFTNQFNYKSWDLNVFFNFSYGNDVYNANRVYFEELDNVFGANNRSPSVFDSWTPTNQDTDIAGLGLGSATSRFQSRYIEDGSFIRLKNISLGYTFKNVILDKTPFNSCKIYISGQNLWTITDYTGYNPEGNTSPVAVAPGVDWGTYPLAKVYTLGLNISF